MSGMGMDLRVAARSLARRSFSTLAVVVTLALAIGSTVAVFSVVDGVLLTRLPFREPDRLVGVWSSQGGDTSERGDIAPADFRDFRERAESFEDLAALTTYWDVNLTGGEGEPERLDSSVVSANFFSVLGISPALGATFEPGHDAVGSENVVVLAHQLWERRFGSDPGIVGDAILLDGEPYTVLGVTRQDLRYPDSKTQVFLPVSYLGDRMEHRNQSFLYMVGRLKAGTTVEAGRHELEGIARRLEAEYPDSNAGRGVNVIPLRRSIVGDVQPAIQVLFGAVLLVLLIACVNVGSLRLAEALNRQQEVIVRNALGASALRSARQPLIESLLLALAGGVLALFLAHWGIQALLSLATDVPRANEIGIDGPVLVFALLITLLTGFLVGTLPAVRSYRTNLNEALKEGGRTTTDRGRWSSHLLLPVQIAVSLVLLIGAGLLIRSFTQLLAVNPGFDPAGTVTFRVSLPDAGYPEDEQRLAFFENLSESIRSLPGVESVGATSRLPMTHGNITTTLTLEGRAHEEQKPEVGMRIVNPEYFEAMEIPLLQGRHFAASDHVDASPVVIVNETLAERVWPGESALGKGVKLGVPTDEEPWVRVVGVVADVRHHGLHEAAAPELFIHVPQLTPGGMTLVVRAPPEPARLVPSIRRRLADIDPDLPAYDVQLMSALVDESLAGRRFTMTLLSIFAFMALLLAAVAIYGSVSNWVVYRYHDIGIRLTLGARRQQILRMIVRRAMWITAAGLALGLLAAFWLVRTIESLVFGVGSTDLATYLLVTLFLAAVAFVACLLPALRATRVDPMTALRYQ